MSDTPQGGENPAKVRSPQGSMFLYKQPEYLNREDHADLGWTSPAKPFSFAKEIMSVPLVASEISSAQKHYPVIFTGKDNPVPMAVLSVMKDRNMFVDAQGQWVIQGQQFAPGRGRVSGFGKTLHHPAVDR